MMLAMRNKEGNSSQLFAVLLMLGTIATPLAAELCSLQTVEPNIYLVIGNSGNMSDGGWRQVSLSEFSQTEAYSAAKVWMKNELIRQVEFVKTSDSGDWMQYVDYCFGPDGRLLAVREEVRSASIGIGRRRQLSPEGKVLLTERKSIEFFALRDESIRTAPDEEIIADYLEKSVESIASVDELPFIKLLNRRKKVRHASSH